MNRKDILDTRKVKINGQGKKQIDFSTMTQKDRDMLLVAIAEAVGAINQRTFLPIEQDTSNDGLE